MISKTMLIIPPSELERKVETLEEELHFLREEINFLVKKIAAFPEPARIGWKRFPDPKIVRVTLDIFSQIVTTYDHTGRAIEFLTGPFNQVGLRVLARTGDMPWEQINDDSPHYPEPVTPIPIGNMI